MRFIVNNAVHISLTMLIVILLVGSWFAGQTSHLDGQSNTVFVVTFILLIPCALFALYLQTRAEFND